MLRSAAIRTVTAGGLTLLGIVGVWAAARAGGAGPAALAAVAAASGVALVLQVRTTADVTTLARVFDGVLLLLPGALVVYFSFNSGGYFPGTPAVAAILLVVALVLRLTLVEQPFGAFSMPLAVAAGTLGLLSLWILLSIAWSHAPGRGLLEFDRAFMYLLALVISGSVARTASRMRWLAGGLAAGVLVVAIAALATRLAPDHFPTSLPVIGESNLAYPLTYSNALGILCVLGAIICLYFATSVNRPLAVRALGSAALPILAATVYLTLSRGPVAAAIIGIGAFALLGRPRGLLTGLAATVPTSVIAVASAYQHPLLTSSHPQAGAAATQGHRVAVVVLLCVLAAAAIRLVLGFAVDERLRDLRLPDRNRRAVTIGGWAALVLAIVIVAAAVNAPSQISDQYHRFVNSGQASPTQDIRQSVFSSANRGLVDNWKVALDAFKAAPLHGQGAGAYVNYWNEHRPAHQSSYNVVNAHSLYVQVLGELGIVGFALLAIVIALILAALAPVARGPNRSLYAALFAMALAWAAHTGIDWDWEMPAVTIPFFAVGGAGLARHVTAARTTPASGSVRVTLSLFLLVGAICPVLVFASQRQLNDARDAVRDGNCTRAIDRAAAAVDTLDARPEAYELIGICQQQRGRVGFAVQAMRKAADLDPDNWRYHFDLAVVQGGVGLDARPELVKAHQLNPTDPQVTQLLRELPVGSAVNWDINLLAPSGASATVK